MKSKYLTLGTALAATLLLAACNGSNGKNNNAEAQNSNSKDHSPVVATVNGEAIHENTLDALLSNLTNGQKVNPPPEAKRQLIDRLVQLKALAQQARKQGLANDPGVQAEIQIQHEALLAKALVHQYLEKHPVTDQDIQTAFKKQTQSMDQKEYKARHILVKDKKTAEKAIDKLNHGAKFAELAKKLSTGPSAKKGGELGWFSPSDMVKPFSNAVEHLKKGQYTKKPVKTQFGWHVILLQDERPVPKPKLADQKSSIKQRLQSQRVQDFVNQVQKKADIDIKQSQAPTPQSGAPAQQAPAPAPAPSSSGQAQATSQ